MTKQQKKMQLATEIGFYLERANCLTGSEAVDQAYVIINLIEQRREPNWAEMITCAFTGMIAGCGLVFVLWKLFI